MYNEYDEYLEACGEVLSFGLFFQIQQKRELHLMKTIELEDRPQKSFPGKLTSFLI